MQSAQYSKPFRDYAKQIFLIGQVYKEKNAARADVDDYLGKMKKSVISMSLSYSHISKLKQKVDNLVSWERKYARFFRTEDSLAEELKSHITALEDELRNEKEEKMRIISESQEKVQEITGAMQEMKDKMKHLHMEKAKRQHRLKILEQKITGKVNRDEYFSS